jgi:CIC family chloride channel protein
MVLAAVVVGILGGYGAIVFRFMIHWFQEAAWRTHEYSPAYVGGLPWWVIVLTPAAGGVIVGLVARYFTPEAKGHGVPEVMEAVALNEGRIRPRVVVGRALASSLSIATGGSVGREGPIVQIGAAIGSSVGQFLRAGPGRLRTLAACGAGAGMAATFNAPIGGALFAVEVVIGDFGVPLFSPIVMASVAATVVSRAYLGDLPAFAIPHYSLVHPAELFAYAVLGVLAGLLAIVFIRVLYFAEDQLDAIAVPLPIKAALGGAAVGVIALEYPGVFGVGYETINVALMGSPTLGLLLMLLVAKLLATSITIGSGGSGGVFAPSLFLGAMLGAAVGHGVQAIAGGACAPPGAYALVGMGAVVAATTHAPITAILIIFELTNEYRVILPLMTSCIISVLLSTRLHPNSIYTLKLTRRGVNLLGGTDINLLRGVRVRDVMRNNVVTVSPRMALPALLSVVARSNARSFYVVDDNLNLQGVISMMEVQALLPSVEALKDLVVASDLASSSGPTVSPDDTLDTVVGRMDGGNHYEVPVVENGVLIGELRTEDMLARYKQEVFKREMVVNLDQQ